VDHHILLLPPKGHLRQSIEDKDPKMYEEEEDCVSRKHETDGILQILGVRMLLLTGFPSKDTASWPL